VQSPAYTHKCTYLFSQTNNRELCKRQNCTEEDLCIQCTLINYYNAQKSHTKPGSTGYSTLPSLPRLNVACGRGAADRHAHTQHNRAKGCSSKKPHPLVDGKSFFSGEGGGIQTAQILGVYRGTAVPFFYGTSTVGFTVLFSTAIPQVPRFFGTVLVRC